MLRPHTTVHANCMPHVPGPLALGSAMISVKLSASTSSHRTCTLVRLFYLLSNAHHSASSKTENRKERFISYRVRALQRPHQAIGATTAAHERHRTGRTVSRCLAVDVRTRELPGMNFEYSDRSKKIITSKIQTKYVRSIILSIIRSFSYRGELQG